MPGFFFKGDQMATQIRFGKKVRVESTFQIKHRLLLWWLKNQRAKEGDAMVGPVRHSPAPMHVHEASL
jgi:hypothetical protein